VPPSLYFHVCTFIFGYILSPIRLSFCVELISASTLTYNTTQCYVPNMKSNMKLLLFVFSNIILIDLDYNDSYHI
jgi:hypothetical protein